MAPMREAAACSCQPLQGSPEAHLSGADAVFVGTVVRVEPWSIPYDNGSLKLIELPKRWAVYEVEHSWKGPATSRVAVHSEVTIAACGVDFEVGEQHLVFAVNASAPRVDLSGLLHVNACMYRSSGTPEEIMALNEATPLQVIREIASDDPSLVPPQVHHRDAGRGMEEKKGFGYWPALALALFLLAIGLYGIRWLRQGD